MITIHDLLNKIKWDKSLKPGDYTLYYVDRITKTLKKMKYSDIIRAEGTFIITSIEGKETSIPMHRMRRVEERKEGEKKARVVWER
jgi:uncharacterized protein (UPF0248 family)